ncbi:MAG: glycine cleavage system protein GcvH [Deltaproteobacteria bacterium]|jgi:glycine cleavage system H protein|nr:glycine cleavage system protein GcvH [Deltaproteobacteria bacterium]
MNIPDDLKYTKEHEWVKLEGDTATIGVTHHAQGQLGDIVYVELPTEGEEISKEDTFGSLESVKAVSDCFAPLSGKVIEINNVLSENPETINEDCYEEGWIVKIELSDKSELEELMSDEQYKAFVAEESA